MDINTGSARMSGGEETLHSAAASPRHAPTKAISVTIGALALSVTLNVFLAQRVQRINQAQSARIAERLLNVGTFVPQITAKRLSGQREVISYPGVRQMTVLYVFTPPCTWCARNMDNLKTLLEKEMGQYRFIGISLSEEGLADYVAKNELNLPVYSGLSAETIRTYKLGSTPQTIVVSPGGKVLKDWVGAYAGGQKSQVEAFFHVTLPGLRELPKAAEEKVQTPPQAN
jgi:peroxiredoxin